jgi:hypothetical protein
MAYMHHVTDPLISGILKSHSNDLTSGRSRYHAHSIHYWSYSTHIRAYAVLDDYYTTSMEAGRFLATIGFVSFLTHRTIFFWSRNTQKTPKTSPKNSFHTSSWTPIVGYRFIRNRFSFGGPLHGQARFTKSLHDPGNVLMGHTGPACDNDKKMFYLSMIEQILSR